MDVEYTSAVLLTKEINIYENSSLNLKFEKVENFSKFNLYITPGINKVIDEKNEGNKTNAIECNEENYKISDEELKNLEHN